MVRDYKLDHSRRFKYYEQTSKWLFNEQENVIHLLRAIRLALSGYDYEIVAVDDGSSDQTVELLRENMDDRLRIVVLMRNYGQTSAMSAGIAASDGKFVVTMDGEYSGT